MVIPMTNLAQVISWAITIWLLIFALAKLFPQLEKLGITIGPFYIMIRAKRLARFIEVIASKWHTIWLIFLDLGIFLGIGQMAFAYYWLLKNLIRFLTPGDKGIPVYPLIPGITIGPESIKYFIPAIILILVTHEVAHGVAARLENIRIRSVGLIIVFLMFGAFVEPDEEDLKKASMHSKLRVLSAGSAMNLLIGLLVLIMTWLIFTQSTAGVLVVDTLRGYPAHGKIAPFSVIIKLNGTKVSSIAELASFLAKTKPGDSLLIEVKEASGLVRSIMVKLASNPRNRKLGFLGVRIVNYIPPRIPMTPYISFELFNLLLWMHMLCLSAAILNMLPIYPFDGGRIVAFIVDEYLKSRAIGLGIKITLVASSIVLFVLNIIFTLLRYSLTPT